MARKETPTPRAKMMVASSARVKAGRRISRTPNTSWQEEAWTLFDEMGELRFASSWISNSVSKLAWRLGKVEDGSSEPVPVFRTEEGEPLTPLEEDAMRLVAELAGGPAHLPGFMQHLGELLAVGGLGWMCIEPDEFASSGWKWSSRSNDEVRDTGSDWEVKVTLDDGPEWDNETWRPVAPDTVMIRVWRRHPRFPDQADSPVRAVIPVLQQLKGIDAHINATSKSRLAGAGILFSPSEVEYQSASDEPFGTDEDDGDDDEGFANVDSLLDDLVENAKRASRNPDNAEAVIPLPIEVPAQYIEAFRHMTFWTEYSDTVIELSERAIRRFALGMDMPPESVTGMSDASHWGAWRVAEEGVTIHIEPLARIITTALSIQWLHVNLLALDHDPAEVAKMVVYGDTTPLLVRPDKSADAIAGYENLEVSGDAMRRESGLSIHDRPTKSEFLRRLLMRAMDRNPELSSVLLPIIAKDKVEPADVEGIDWSEVSAEHQTFGVRSLDGRRDRFDQFGKAGQSQPTPTRTIDDVPPELAAALVASMDGVVYRALERAGNRFRSEVGKGVPGGNSVVASIDGATLHTVISPPEDRVASLLAGAFDRVAELGVRLGVDGHELTASVEAYTRGLLVSGQAHTIEDLASWLATA